MQRAIEQTRQRVLLGRELPAEEKVVSVFETHVDILAKQRRETVFGHKICPAGGASCLITDCTIEHGNPPDSLLAPKMIVKHEGIFDKVPRQAAWDWASLPVPTLRPSRSTGHKIWASHKKRGLQVNDMVKSSCVFRQLRNFALESKAVSPPSSGSSV